MHTPRIWRFFIDWLYQPGLSFVQVDQSPVPSRPAEPNAATTGRTALAWVFRVRCRRPGFLARDKDDFRSDRAVDDMVRVEAFDSRDEVRKVRDGAIDPEFADGREEIFE